MALANIAVLLAQEGKRVLAIDWDLEAPGLERYFHYFPIDPNGAGLLPMLTDLSHRSRRSYRDYAWTVEVGSDIPITLLPSGREQDSVGYADQLEKFDWSRFFLDGGGDRLEELRRQWKQDFDLVLIDSRTGLSDTGGVCTIQLPDIVVVMFSATEQSFLGARDVMRHVRKARQALAYPRMELTVFPLPARIGSSEFQETKKWIDRFGAEFAEFYEDWLPSWARPHEVLERVKIPQVDYFGFGEKLAVVEQGVSDPGGMGFVYDQIARVLRDDFRGTHEVLGLRQRVSRDRRAAPKTKSDEDYRWHLYVSHTNLSYLETWLTEFLQRMKVELSRSLGEEAEIFFDRQEVVLGASWPDQVKDALLHSRLLLPVLTPAYFRSAWNQAEWRTFEERERTTASPGQLIFPITLPGGDKDPTWLRQRTLADASLFTSARGDQWPDAAAQFVRDITETLSSRLRQVPPFQSDFPIVSPVPPPQRSTHGAVESFVEDQLVVDLADLTKVQRALQDIGVAWTEVDRDSRLGLALLTLDNVAGATAELRSGDDGLVRRVTAAKWPGGPPPQAGPSDLDVLLYRLRTYFSAAYTGWIPAIGKNRTLAPVRGFPLTSGGDASDPYFEGEGVDGNPQHVFSDQPWAPRASRPGHGVRIGLLDTRLYPNPWLDGGYLATSQDLLRPDPGSPPIASAGHATFTAGLILKRAPGAQIDVRPVLDGYAFGTAWHAAKTMADVAAAGVDILNLSFGCYTDDGQPPLVLAKAVRLVSPQALLVAAAGNHGNIEELRAAGYPHAAPWTANLTNTTPVWPAALPEVTAVGATDRNGHVAAFSPKAPWVDVTAPGVGLVSTYLAGEVRLTTSEGNLTVTFDGLASWDGTTFAAANLTGAVAAEIGRGRDAWQALEEAVLVDPNSGIRRVSV